MKLSAPQLDAHGGARPPPPRPAEDDGRRVRRGEEALQPYTRVHLGLLQDAVAGARTEAFLFAPAAIADDPP
jgi:hypothetical protein